MKEDKCKYGKNIGIVLDSFRKACLEGKTRAMIKTEGGFALSLANMTVLYKNNIKWKQAWWRPRRLILTWSRMAMIDECCRAFFGRPASPGEKIFRVLGPDYNVFTRDDWLNKNAENE